MDKETRNAIERATQRARKLLEEDFAAQLEGDFDVHRNGVMAAKAGVHLSARHAFQRERIVAAINHKRAAGMGTVDSAADYLRDAAFTTINRFVALKMLEARELVQECITKGERSAGYLEFSGMAPGLLLLPNSDGYRLYIESLFDELSTEVKVLFDRRDPSSVLWPKRATFEQLIEMLNAAELGRVWGEDETIGWVYQFFNGQDERKRMREESPAPRNSRELAVRNQFFTPRYVVQFLTDNTLGRIWYEMQGAKTALADRCDYMVRKPGEEIAPRAKKDPRDLRVLDPACGSGHFLLYAFDLLLAIYEEAYADSESPKCEATCRTLAEDYPSLDALRMALPSLILEHNLHGVDIDPRCAQIAQLALWMRAQKAYRDFGIGRAERAQIRRSNIVVAEPLVADEQIAKEFVAKLDDVEVERVFTALVESLNLAGDLGLLLRVEQLVGSQAKRGQTGDLFAPPEERIRAALARFVNDEGEGANPQRRLFAEDAAQGMGLLGVAEKRFDAVLMNPPFGEPTVVGLEYIQREFPEGVNDIFAAFVLRMSKLVASGGRIGAITSRSFIVGRDLRKFRKAILDDPSCSLEMVLDLGLGVLDAMVETAAYILGDGSKNVVRFQDLRDTPKVADSIRRALGDSAWMEHDREYFRKLPHCQFLYQLSENEAGALLSDARIEPSVGRVTKGLSTGDDERFVRLRWEVPSASAGSDDGWEPFSKGGEYGWFSADTHLLINRRADGAELAAHAERTHGNVALSRQSSTYYGKAAATWSRRSQKGFSARRLRSGVCFSDKSPVIVPTGSADRWVAALLAALASNSYLNLIYAQSKFGSYETGSIKTLPAPDCNLADAAVGVMGALFRGIDEIDARDELCQLFVAPPSDAWDVRERICSAVSGLENLLQPSHECSRTVAGHTLETLRGRIEQVSSTASRLSYSMGTVLGRWNGDALALVALPGPLDELGRTSPAEVGQSESDRQSDSEWLTDDEGARSDIVAAVQKYQERFWASREENVDQLRSAIRREFFAAHTAHYSKSARKAPVYWQLASSTAKYSAWAYYQRLSRDSLFRLQNDHALPKLRHEEQKLEALRAEFGTTPPTAQRKVIAIQDAFVGELRNFVDELGRVAPIWNPDFDDGVVVNFAPLWRLVPHHKAWQKELKATWDALCEGTYDWAHLAMRLWPERVVPKCAEDRSLAIAHGLEDVFWAQGTDAKWTARKTATRSVEELIRERTSAAVKSALRSLLEGPAASGSAGRARGGRRKAAAEGGNV
ncbi:BREX-1 system adenine-specific DNA-methyltransferase PglX [Caballeronia sp. GAFFF2]|uniref:BREX-1 system adenine-specific DNA-methyltransferase PglX n=1 Tax=Caballeronia sp. GAFFF2 TaxID=2921741 RepID=UPI00202842AE|nr:BREX-1 system adenine-specific DNA-methyltransferase PglX [Caballeronia sp. GAFFF2]